MMSRSPRREIRGLKELRGCARTTVVEPWDKRHNGFEAEPALVEAVETPDPAPRQVSMDGASVGYEATIDLVRAARRRGVEAGVVTGRLVSPLDTTRLLLRRFDFPVMRVRNESGDSRDRRRVHLRACLRRGRAAVPGDPRERGRHMNGASPPSTPGTARHRERAPQLDEALQVALAQAAWLRANGPTSWDQYDFWANPIGRRAKATYYRHEWLGLPTAAPFVLLDNALPGSRRFFRHRQRFPIADAHYAMGFLALAVAHSPDWLRSALAFIEALVMERCASEPEFCWGYPFDWETCFGTWPAGTPLITTTPYAYEAFEAAHEATGNPQYLAIMESIARFAQTRIAATEVALGIKASAYSPHDQRRVVNASAYRGFLLAAAGSRFCRADWLTEARATLAFVLWSQQRDGSWLYAMDGKDAFVDNFHTCFVLKNLFKAWRVLGDPELRAAVDRGYGFYKSHLLDEQGLPVPFARAQRLTLQRRELYDYAEGINLGLLLVDEDGDASAITTAMISDVLARWVMADGHFVTRETVFGRNTIPYLRWGQAQVFHALARVARAGAG
jgi:hypothetical protein